MSLFDSTAPEFAAPERIVRAVMPLTPAGSMDGIAGTGQRPGFDPGRPGVPDVIKRFPFEVYIVGYSDANRTTAYVKVYRGIIRANNDALTTIAIGSIDTQFSINSTTTWLYLEADFDGNGALETVTLNASSSFGDGTGTFHKGTGADRKWYHPIAHVRAFKTGKVGGGVPDSGEYGHIATGYFISQKTNTHLAVGYYYGNPFYGATYGDTATNYPMLVPAPGGQD